MGLHQQFHDPKKPTANYFPPAAEEVEAFQKERTVRRKQIKVDIELAKRKEDRERKTIELERDAEHNAILAEANRREEEMVELMKAEAAAQVAPEAETPVAEEAPEAETSLQDGILKREEAGLISPPEDEKRSRKRGTVKGK